MGRKKISDNNLNPSAPKVKVESNNKYGKLWIDEHQILNLKYHPGVEIDLDAAKFLVNERLKLCNGNYYLLLLDIKGLKLLTSSASKYFSSEEGSVLISRGAIIVGSFFSSLIGNSYLKLNPPLRPAKLFTNREEAIKWLLKPSTDASF